MNIFGMGTLEILAILLVAFIFLGPEKMIAGAKKLGQLTRDARNISSNFNSLISDDQNKNIHMQNRHENDKGISESESDAVEFQKGPSGQTSKPQHIKSSHPESKNDPEK